MEQENKIPVSIGDYEIIRSLAHGLMSELFLARTGNLFHAVKVLDNRYAQRLDSAARFVDEILHENILQYKAIKFDPQYQHYFVFDYLEVRPVSYRRLKTEGHKKILDIFVQTAKALAMAHSKGVIHGNLKPSNVLIRRTDEGDYMPIVSDFGLSYIYDRDYFCGENFKKVFTYMSPEYIAYFTSSGGKSVLPESVTPASDVYSLAIVLAEVLTGKSLYDDEDFVDLPSLLHAKEHKHFRLIAVNHPSASINVKVLNDAINKALAFSAEERINSMEEFASVLESAKAL